VASTAVAGGYLVRAGWCSSGRSLSTVASIAGGRPGVLRPPHPAASRPTSPRRGPAGERSIVLPAQDSLTDLANRRSMRVGFSQHDVIDLSPQPGLARVAQYSAQVGQARLASGRGRRRRRRVRGPKIIVVCRNRRASSVRRPRPRPYSSTGTVLRCPSSSRINSRKTSFAVVLAFQCACTVPGFTNSVSPGFSVTGSFPSF